MTAVPRTSDNVSALLARRSTRAYLARPIGRRLIEDILNDARWAPSGGNMQPWRVIVTVGDARRDVVAVAHRWLDAGAPDESEGLPVYPAGLPEEWLARRKDLGRDFYGSLGLAKNDDAALRDWSRVSYSFFGAPAGAFFLGHRAMGAGQWAHLGMFMQSVALAAERRGAGTCFQEAWAHLRGSLRRHFGLGRDDIVYCGMALGWPDPVHIANRFRSHRAAVSEFADFRGFGDETQ